MPRIIPVIDVLNGVVVRAVGGRRDEYRPIVSRRTDSTDPAEVARTLLAVTGGDELYVADLDAITGFGPATAVTELMAATPERILLDASGSGPYPLPPSVREVLSLEARLDRVRYETHARLPGAVFSVDLVNGVLADGWQDWGLRSAWSMLELVRAAHGLGYRAFVVLDVGSVGRSMGAGTDDLLRLIRHDYPDIELIAGGGVRGRDDIDRLGDAGVDGILVASALHDGLM